MKKILALILCFSGTNCALIKTPVCRSLVVQTKKILSRPDYENLISQSKEIRSLGSRITNFPPDVSKAVEALILKSSALTENIFDSEYQKYSKSLSRLGLRIIYTQSKKQEKLQKLHDKEVKRFVDFGQSRGLSKYQAEKLVSNHPEEVNHATRYLQENYSIQLALRKE